MEIKGKVLQLLDIQTGEGKNGTWKKQDFVIETTDSKYPKKVCITVWGDKIDQFQLKDGEDVTASIEIESREFNGKWYTNVQAWRVQKGTGSQDGVDNIPPPFVPANIVVPF